MEKGLGKPERRALALVRSICSQLAWSLWGVRSVPMGMGYAFSETRIHDSQEPIGTITTPHDNKSNQ